MAPVTVAWDTETALLTDMVKAPALTCVSWAEREPSGHLDTGLFKWDGDLGTGNSRDVFVSGRDSMAEILEKDINVGANIAYDMGVVMVQWPELTPLIFEAYEQNRVGDVQVSAKLIDNAEGIMHRHPVSVIGPSGKPSCYSLAALARRFLGKELDKDTYRMGYGALRDVPLEQWEPGARQYPIDDAVSTLEVWGAEQLGYPELLEDQFRQARHAFWLHLVGVHGIRTDPARVAALEKRLIADKEERIERLVTAGLIHPKQKKNPKTQTWEWSRNTKAAKARMMQVCQQQARAWKETEGGDVCLDKEACEESGDEILDAYQEVASLTKRLGTEIKALKLGEIHARFDSYKTTGRTGCSEPTNLQNLPRSGGERECYVPRPGFLFADSDYDMLELRTWAQACLELVGESTLADELNAGIDVHLSTGGEILGGISYDEMRARKGEKRVKEARQTAKPVNFMLPGGGGAERLVDAAKKDYGIILPTDPDKDWVEKKGKVGGEWKVLERYKKPGVEYARQLVAAWKRKRTEAQPYLDLVAERVREAGGTNGAVCEALFVKRYHGGCGYCDLANRYFQALGADVFKDAGWRITRDCWDWTQGSVLYGSRIVIPAHDQFIVEVPIPIAHECALKIAAHMVGPDCAKWLPDVPPTTTPCLATCFSKMAEPYYDEAGRLIPWSLEGQIGKILGEGLNLVLGLKL